MKNLGFRLGDQREAELLLDDWAKRDFRRLIGYCRSADAFQDIPFSLDYTFQAMDAAFPGSKFILSVRDDADQWYRSLTRFHAKRRGLDQPPTAEQLKADPYVWTGFMWHASQLMYGVDESNVWDEGIYKRMYVRHIESVQDYFKHRPDDLLTINLAAEDSMQRLCEFLKVPISAGKMPKLNVSG